MKKIGLLALIAAASCSQYRALEQIKDGSVGMVLSVPEEPVSEPEPDMVLIDSIRSEIPDGPLIMKAVRDDQTGEMVATDVISASKVVARFRNVAERAGYVSISFDVMVPAGMSDSDWQLKIFPYMAIQKDTVRLDPIYVTGKDYRGKQLRGYERYRAFLASIISDPQDFLKLGQLEIFLERHFPETFAMKNDSSYVSDSMAENLFGVTPRDAFEHYRRNVRWNRNERRKARVEEMRDRYIKDPIPDKDIRLDTVLTSSAGDFIYRYTHTFRSRPGLRKVVVSMDGRMYRDGECFLDLPFSDEITFYISSLASLTDDRIRYRMHIRERVIYDNTKAFIDFAHASSEVDTSLGCNASEFERIRQCVEDIYARKEYVLDSLVIAASCSPEGALTLNRNLSLARSMAVRDYISDFVPSEWKDSLKTADMPENWDQFMRLVENDTVMPPQVRREIVAMASRMEGGPDAVEERLSLMPEYPYIKEVLYPKLRNVSFDFHLHRADMVQDTVRTTEVDSVYMNGVQAIRDMNYKKAVTVLRPYDDYNAALAFMCADYNHSAMDVLGRLEDSDPRVCYLKAMVLARLERLEEALGYYELAVAYDPRMAHRANLDPEMYQIVKYSQINKL